MSPTVPGLVPAVVPRFPPYGWEPGTEQPVTTVEPHGNQNSRTNSQSGNREPDGNYRGNSSDGNWRRELSNDVHPMNARRQRGR
jgi:hypothetical protein